MHIKILNSHERLDVSHLRIDFFKKLFFIALTNQLKNSEMTNALAANLACQEIAEQFSIYLNEYGLDQCHLFIDDMIKAGLKYWP